MKIQLQTVNPVEILPTLDPPEAHTLVSLKKTEIATSEKRSLGYETMTTVSDLESEVILSFLNCCRKSTGNFLHLD